LCCAARDARSSTGKLFSPGAVVDAVDDVEALLARRAEPLAWPMAAVGAIGGWYIDETIAWGVRTGSACLGDVDTGWRGSKENVVLAALGGVGFFILGRWLAAMLKDGRAIRLAALVGTLACGLTVGMASLFFTGDKPSLELGLAIGVTAAPWCVCAASLATRAWHARSGTVAHRLYRRLMWLAVGGQTATMVLNHANEQIEYARGGGGWGFWLPPLSPDHLPTSQLAVSALVCAVVGGIVVAASCLRDIVRLRALHRRLETTPPPRGTPERHDLGLGDELRQWLDPARNPYREQDALRAEVRGDYQRVRRALGFASAAALAFVVLAAVMLLLPRDLCS
jgi:hypothetical protein